MLLLGLLLLVVCVIAVVGFLGYGGQTLAGGGPGRESGLSGVLRGGAALAAAVAFAVYGWGLLGLAGALMDVEDGGTGSAPVRPCRASGWEEGAGVVGYDVTWVPLAFVCETGDGGSYGSGDVPAYVNPLVFLFGVAAAGGALSSAYVGEARARRRRPR
ncbi:hypothetical protein AB0K92_26465 [Streptomyces sp. NPDC052687]|uniref:hypothetical protein n=1 Tax=Streptomyces sp. NPDC052687 TaxID=3154759 RepID=UPI0034280952